MRYILGLCLFALTLPCFAADPANAGPTLAERFSWEGKHSDELIEQWGKPNKSKPHGEGGRLLVYKLRFFGGRMVGDQIIDWEEVDCDPGRPGETDLLNSATPKVTATQKVTLYLDAEGVVRGQEFFPVKWKGKP